MLRYRKPLIILVTSLLGGALLCVVGYEGYVRSDWYRRSLADRLSKRLGMELTIGSVVPLSMRSRELFHVRARSRTRHTEVFGCERAVWQREPDGEEFRYALNIEDGWLIVGAREWAPSDYQEMLRSGLGHNFAELGIGRIELTDIDLQWKHPPVVLSARRSRGGIEFDETGMGRASLVARFLNDVAMAEPIAISARFTPGAKLRFHHVELTVGETPLSALRLDKIVGGSVSQGRFAGSVTYRHRDGRGTVSVSGALREALLAELSGTMPGGPYSGRVDVIVDEATFEGKVLRALRFNGELRGLESGQLIPELPSGPLTGQLDLRVHQATYRDGRIEYFSAEGRASGVSLEPLTELLGGGRVTGKLDLSIHSLLIVDDRLVFAEITADVVPPNGGAGTIDREVISRVSKRTLGFDVTSLLPRKIQRIDYTRAGAELELNRGQLRVRGTHGRDQRTVLTVKLMGREIGLIRQPDDVYHVEDLVGMVREHISHIDSQRLRRWLGARARGDESARERGN